MFFCRLKSEDSNIFWTGHGRAPEREGLKSFFNDAVARQSQADARKIYIIMDGETAVGHLYIIPSSVPGEFDLSAAVLKEFGGKGCARQAIALGLQEGKRLGFTKMVSRIREDNIASMRAYTACGVTVTDTYEMVYIPKLEKEVKMFRVEIDL